MERNQAEILAIRVMEWLATDNDKMRRFLASTGMTLTEIRTQLDNPDVLASVLDFLLLDDREITEFCRTSGYRPEAPMQARHALPGGDSPHWL
ncbi:MAG: DUF3572 domain-containing protein [Rhodobacteraceae bacterium]|nr:DUF3572 domain-containing protein [Paracoccaceae bacterium]